MTETATYRQLRRSTDDRMLAGVCGGLGEYFEVNPAFYRVGFVVLSLLGGAGILAYGACVLVIPSEGRDESIASAALRQRRPAALVGLALVVVAAIALISQIPYRLDNDAIWIAVLVIGAGLLWSQRAEPRAAAAPASSPPTGEPPLAAPAAAGPAPPTPPRRRSPLPLALGALVVVVGLLGLLEAADVDIPWAIILAVAAIAVGAAVVAGAVYRQRVGGLAALGLLLAGAAIVASAVDLHLDDGIGNREYHPLTAAELRPEYRLGIGELELDLSDVPLAEGTTEVEVDVGIGLIEILLPADVPVHVRGQADWGDVNLPGGIGTEGRDVESELVEGSPRLVVDAEIGAGRIDVYRAVR